VKHIACAVLFTFVVTVGTARADMQGAPVAVDGDTLRFAGRLVHLYGIDAPEMAQVCQNKRGREFDCGVNARRTLNLIITNTTISCREKYRDSRGDIVAVCKRGRMDIAEQLVLQGWALSDPRTGGEYRRAERAAQGMRDGLWRLKFVPPWEWRRANP
jgi:endonuclease YncB( thermonuclease family)